MRAQTLPFWHPFFLLLEYINTLQTLLERGDQQTSQVFLKTIRAHAQILEYII